TAKMLCEWAAEQADLPLWLLQESQAVVGDMAETIALVLPRPTCQSDISLSDLISLIADLATLREDQKRDRVQSVWDKLGVDERCLFNKLITGGFRVSVTQKQMARALARVSGLNETALIHRLAKGWKPDQISFAEFIAADSEGDDASHPYPIFPTRPLEGLPPKLGLARNWVSEWKWDGIRGQLIVRNRRHYIWSRSQELVTERFPELGRSADFLPDGTVIDGEIIAWQAGLPLPLNAVEKRIGRKTVPKALLRDAPCILMAFDLLEQDGIDLRPLPLKDRQARLQRLMRDVPCEAGLRLSEQIEFDDWNELTSIRAIARDRRTRGVMLKHRESPYPATPEQGNWRAWEVDPLTMDAVMIYAQSGQGRALTPVTELTLAVWSGNELVPIAKVRPELSTAELGELTAWIQKNTTQRFGPVRQVTPQQVFGLAFDTVCESPRHKSGISLRNPRLTRWHRDSPVQQATTLDDLRVLLSRYG
ncbi:MAG: cisplatin damage response ATP-dependent DNA ligase, partial [Phaeobacter italicus]